MERFDETGALIKRTLKFSAAHGTGWRQPK
jgi:hypothetical protein